MAPGTAFTSGHNVAPTASQVTASKTWRANRLYKFTVVNFDGTAAVTPAVSDFTSLHNYVHSANVQITHFWYVPSVDVTDAKTISFSGTSQDHIQWVCDEEPSLDLSGGGLAAILQHLEATGTGTSTLTVALGAFSSSSNPTWMFGWNQGGNPETAGGGATALSSDTDFYRILTQQLEGNDTNPSMSQAPATDDWYAFAIEFKAAGSAIDEDYGVSGMPEVVLWPDQSVVSVWQ